MPFSTTLKRRSLLAAILAAPMLSARPAFAANVAEAFVADNIHKGLEILNNKKLSTAQRRDQFEVFLLGLADLRRISDFVLGNYRRTASPADIEAFSAAFKNYAVAVYQFYFSKYNGQTLKVTGSTINPHAGETAPTDFIVHTMLIDPQDNNPLPVDFRIRTDGGKPVLVDVAAKQLWLSQEQRDACVSYLGNHGGSFPALIAHLSDMAANLGK